MGGKSSKGKRQPEPVAQEPKKEGYKYQHIVVPEANDPAPANADPKVANPPSEAVKNQNQNNRPSAASNQPANTNVHMQRLTDAIYPPLPNVPIPPISEETDPYNLALNLSAVSDSFLKLVHAVQNHWDRDNVMNEIFDSVTNFEKSTINMRDDRRIRNWIKPVHYRSTGLLITRSKYTGNDMTRIRTMYDQLRTTRDAMNNNNLRREFSDILKSVVENFWWFHVGYESVVTRDVQDQIQICTDAMSALQTLDIDNYSKWEINHRKFVLATLKLVRIANLRALQQRNGAVLKELSDMVYNILRSTKVFHLVAKKALQDPNTTSNLINLYQAVFDQMRRLEQVLVTVDQLAPDVDRIIMTQDTITEFSDQYTNVIKEVTDALESFKFKAKPNQAADFEKQVRVIIDCIEVFKRVLVTPNNEAFTAATIRACEAIEKSCIDIYRIMPLELDLTLRELVLYSLQTELHFVFQARTVAAMKALYYLIAPAEISQFNALRLLLLAKSVLLTHAAIMVTYGDSTLDEFIEVDGSPENDYRDLTTIWHSGRGLPSLWQDPNAVGPGPTLEEIHNSPTKSKLPVTDDEALDGLMAALGIKGGAVVTVDPEPAPEPEPEPEPEPVVQTPEKPDKRRKSSLGGKRKTDTPAKSPEPKNNNNTNNTNVKVETPTKTSGSKKPKTSNAKPLKNSNKNTPTTTPTRPAQPTVTTTTSPSKPVVAPTAAPSNTNAPKVDVSMMMKADLNNIPAGYPPAPPKPVLKPGASNEEYKAYMVQKYEYEEWENRLLLVQRKIAQGLPWQ